MRADSVIDLLMNVPKSQPKSSFSLYKSSKVQIEPNSAKNGETINVASKSSNTVPEIIDPVGKKHSNHINNSQLLNPPSVENEKERNSNSIVEVDSTNPSHYIRKKAIKEKNCLQQFNKMMQQTQKKQKDKAIFD